MPTYNITDEELIEYLSKKMPTAVVSEIKTKKFLKKGGISIYWK